MLYLNAATRSAAKYKKNTFSTGSECFKIKISEDDQWKLVTSFFIIIHSLVYDSFRFSIFGVEICLKSQWFLTPCQKSLCFSLFSFLLASYVLFYHHPYFTLQLSSLFRLCCRDLPKVFMVSYTMLKIVLFFRILICLLFVTSFF